MSACHGCGKRCSCGDIAFTRNKNGQTAIICDLCYPDLDAVEILDLIKQIKKLEQELAQYTNPKG